MKINWALSITSSNINQRALLYRNALSLRKWSNSKVCNKYRSRIMQRFNTTDFLDKKKQESVDIRRFVFKQILSRLGVLWEVECPRTCKPDEMKMISVWPKPNARLYISNRLLAIPGAFLSFVLWESELSLFLSLDGFFLYIFWCLECYVKNDCVGSTLP